MPDDLGRLLPWEEQQAPMLHLVPVEGNPHNPAPVTLDPYAGNDPHNPQVFLHSTDEDPWAAAGIQGDAKKAAQQLQTTEAERREILNKLVRSGPGRVAAPNPYPPGSEEWEFYEQSRSSGISQAGAQTALNMIGGGTSFAPRGALGVAGGRPFRELSLDEQLAKLHEINQGLQQDVVRAQEYRALPEPSLEQIPADASHSLPQRLPPAPTLPSVSERGARYAAQLADQPERETGLAAAYRHAREGAAAEQPQSQLFSVQHPQALSHFNEHILPHYGSEQEFADRYFAGHHSPEIEMDRVGNMLEFGGVLRNENGKMVGTISRQIDPVEGTAHHGYLKLNPDLQGSGLAKELLGNQMELYQKMGLKSVDLFADIDVGSYAWAKYGFLPAHQGEWSAVKQIALRRLADPHIGGKLEHEDYQAVRQILQRSDPEAMWDLADMKLKLPNGDPVAKRLLMNNSWNGKIDLDNPEAMERFNAYVKRQR